MRTGWITGLDHECLDITVIQSNSVREGEMTDGGRERTGGIYSHRNTLKHRVRESSIIGDRGQLCAQEK